MIKASNEMEPTDYLNTSEVNTGPAVISTVAERQFKS